MDWKYGDNMIASLSLQTKINLQCYDNMFIQSYRVEVFIMKSLNMQLPLNCYRTSIFIY